MIIVRMAGGLGNQMFQYATGLGIARRHGEALGLDIVGYEAGERSSLFDDFRRSFALDGFCISGKIVDSRTVDRMLCSNPKISIGGRALRFVHRRVLGKAKRIVREKANQGFDPTLLSLGKDKYLEGFWQSEKYFRDITPLVRQEFTPRDTEIADYAARYAGARRRASERLVCVHVRRGDLVYAYEVLKRPETVHGPPVSADYIRSAMAKFGPGCRFLFFSDTRVDITWCKKHFAGPNIEFSEGHDAMRDFAIMSECDDFVISNSTFSWWAAWLSTTSSIKRVVAPANWFNKHYGSEEMLRDLIPQGWVLL